MKNKSMKNKYAPIILFTYRRLDTLKLTISSLLKNRISKNSKIFIFSDGYKNSEDKLDVQKVREYLKDLKSFKKKKLYFRKKNFGLAKNITQGVTEILRKEKVGIILEDDVIVSRNFLSYMNLCLKKYENEKRIWHINAWNYNLNDKKNKDTNEIFLWRGMHCWGWATWQDRWKFYEKNINNIYSSFSKDKKYKFNYDGTYDFWQQVDRNYSKKINTWAIFWYAKIFIKKGLCLSPKFSLSQNIGNDRYATNMMFNNYNIKPVKYRFDKKWKFFFPKKIIENKKLFNQIKKYLLKKKLLDKFKSILNFDFLFTLFKIKK